MLIDELRSIQGRSGGFLPAKELKSLAARIKLPLYEIEGVASFYPEFHLTPPPRVDVKVCLDLSCHLRGAFGLLKSLQNHAGKSGEGVKVTGCSCLGQCDRAPAMSINDHIVAGAGVAKSEAIATAVIDGKPLAAPHIAALAVSARLDPYNSAQQHYGVVRALATSPDFAQALDNIIPQLEAASLRGMGGAGVKAALKWTELRKAKRQAVLGTSAVSGLVNPAPNTRVSKYVICNADESEVGTFKDREILLSYPHLLVEGMIIAALVVGADKGFIYIRHEYHAQADRCRKEIERARSIGMLGPNVAGTGRPFDMEVFISPGGYIQGEQSALLEALEGKRGQPRSRRSDVGAEGSASVDGLWHGPTLINNVETLAYVPLIVSEGGQAFADLGAEGKLGLKWVGVSGDVNKPGVFEIPLGTTYRELLEMAGGMRGGKALQALVPSGPSYGIHPPSLLDTPTDFGQLSVEIPRVGSGAIIFLDESRCLVDVALNLTQFFRNESCGKCVPCRIGSAKMTALIDDVSTGKPHAGDEPFADLIKRLADTLKQTSICGLGQVVHMPIESVLRWWPAEIDAHLKGACPKAICGRQERRA